jgi:hypothetical protein
MTMHDVPPEPELTDVALDALWDRHLDGHLLPAMVRACMTVVGPQIEIRHWHAAHLWRKYRTATAGR